MKFVKLAARWGNMRYDETKTVWINPYAVGYVYAEGDLASIVFHDEYGSDPHYWELKTNKPLEEVVRAL